MSSLWPGSFGLSRKNTLLLTILVLSVIVAYIPLFWADFVWDDSAIIDNYGLRSPSGLKDIWLNPSVLVDEGHYWPVVYSTFWIEWNLWGLNPLGFHLDNLILYILNVLVLWWILKRLRIQGAWLITMLFALHPFHAESVTWTIERKDVLYGLFYLGCFLSFTYYEEKRKVGFYLLSLGLLVLGMLSKSACITVPFVLLIYIWWKEGRVSLKKFAVTIPYFVLAFGIGLLDTWRTRGMSEYHSGFTITARLIVAGRAVFHYVIKGLFPIHLTPIYPQWEMMPVQHWQLIYPAAVAAVFIALWLARKRLGRGPLACYALLLITVAPTLGLVDFSFMRLSYVADRFAYLGVLGLLIPVGIPFSKGLQKSENKRLWIVSFSVVLVFLAVQTWRRTDTYDSNEGFWKENIGRNPDSYHAYYCLGYQYMQEGKLEKSEGFYREALRLKPDHPLALNNLGQLLVGKNEIGKAIEHFRRSLKSNPNNASAENNLGTALARTGRYEEALEHLRKAHEMDPEDEGPLLNMGHVYRFQSDWDTALKHYTEAWRNNPGNPMVHTSLAEAFLAKGEPDKALRSFQAALEIDPEDAALRARYADVVRGMGRHQEAIKGYERALRLDPGYLPALRGLAWIRASAAQGEFRNGREALRLAQAACQITDNGDPRALDVLAAAYAELGEFDAARKAASDAAEIARKQGLDDLVREIQRRSALYGKHEPFRQ